jgi:hypothetical protein
MRNVVRKIGERFGWTQEAIIKYEDHYKKHNNGDLSEEWLYDELFKKDMDHLWLTLGPMRRAIEVAKVRAAQKLIETGYTLESIAESVELTMQELVESLKEYKIGVPQP